MIENILTVRGLSLKSKVTVKCLISVGVIASAVVLPQLFHSAPGAQGGVRWLPMYAPVLLGACLLGWAWGQIEAGLHGLAVQAVLIPVVVTGLRLLLTKDRND